MTDTIDLDELMELDPLSLSDQQLEQIIAYHRKQRARRAAGEKPSRDTTGPKVDLSTIVQGLKPAKPIPKIERKV